MLLLTDRISDARPLWEILQGLQPCEVAGPNQPTTRPNSHAIIICDVALDQPTSVAQLRSALARHRQRPTTPVIILLRDPSHVTIGQAHLAGATATLHHPVAAAELRAAVACLMEAERASGDSVDHVAEIRTGAKDAGRILTKLFQSGAARQPISAVYLSQGSDILLKVMNQAKIQAWLDVVWSYDDATYQHCLLVAGLATAFALELALPPSMQHLLSQAALVHDIGKAQVPRTILNKVGPLTTAEMAVIRIHPEAGHRMLVGQPDLDPQLLEVTRHHHEYLDGSGYPDGLRAPQISRSVRMVTICDIYAALVERRVYRRPLDSRTALAHLDDLGPKLDQALVKAFRNVVRDA